jgi:hypothetical protein
MARPSFSTVGTYFMTTRDISSMYGWLGEYQLAYEWAGKSLEAQNALVPPRPAMDVLGVLLNLIEYGARAHRPEEELERALAQFVQRMPEGNNAMPFMHVVGVIAVRCSAGRLGEATKACSEFFEMARRMELPRGHPIWREASYWLTLAGMQLAVGHDSKASLATKHLHNMLLSDRMCPSNACYLEAFELNADEVRRFCTLLRGATFHANHLPMLSWRNVQLAVQKLFARVSTALVLAGVTGADATEPAIMAAGLLAMHPHDLVGRATLTFTPKTDHRRFVLETMELPPAPERTLRREVVVSESDGGGSIVAVAAAELHLAESRPCLVLLRDPVTDAVLESQLWFSRAFLALSKPSPDTVADTRAAFSEVIDAIKAKANPRAAAASSAATPKVLSKSLSGPKSAAVPLWKVGAAAAVAGVAVAAVAWFVWGRSNKDN